MNRTVWPAQMQRPIEIAGHQPWFGFADQQPPSRRLRAFFPFRQEFPPAFARVWQLALWRSLRACGPQKLPVKVALMNGSNETMLRRRRFIHHAQFAPTGDAGSGCSETG